MIVPKRSGKNLSSRATNQSKEMNIADSVLLSLFMRGYEMCNISHAPPVLACYNVLHSLLLQVKYQKNIHFTLFCDTNFNDIH